MIDLTHTKVEEFIMTVQTPYRYDVVGSFLRPAKLKQARKDYESKKISREERPYCRRLRWRGYEGNAL